MSSPGSERMDALTEATVRLLKRVEGLESRLARLEGLQPAEASPESFRPAGQHVPPPLPVSAPPTPVANEPEVEAPKIEVKAPPVSGAAYFEAPRPADRPELETWMGLTWINRIGVVTLIIGVAFFFKYAIDNQWIGETGRVVLGVLAGLATLIAGDILWRRGHKIYAQGICGLAVSILYLSFYATFGFYHLLPQGAAFALMAMVTLMAGALALRYDAMAIAALGMLGGYATPILLSTGVDAPWTFLSYIFLIDLGAVVMARPRRWRLLDLMAFVATVILYTSWFNEWFRPAKEVVATTAVLAYYALFAFVEWSWIFYASQVLAGLALAVIWPETQPFLGLSLVVGAAGIVAADQMRRPLAATFSFATFWAAYWIWETSHHNPAVTIFLFLTVAFAMYLLWTPFQRLVRHVEVRTEHLAILALNGAIYFGASYLLLKGDYKPWMGLFAVAVAGAHLLIGMRLWQERVATGGDTRPVLLALGIALGFLTLAVPIQFTGYSITLSWAVEAAALVWVSRKTNEILVFFGACAIYTFVSLRLYAFDMSLPEVHSLLVNSRFLTLLVASVSFWLGAWWAKETMRPPAALGYATGHFIMLSACLFEFDDWVLKAVSIENQGSALAIGVSILMAMYAVMLISIGVAYRSALDRILGLGLIGLVVLKLYLYDVWEASHLFRTIAFVALGVLLLLTSYLYSRFRPTIENWWKDEKAP